MTRTAHCTGALLATGLLLLAGCQPSPRPRGSAAAAAAAACRTEVDRVYAKQNRADLSIRDQRDTPFAAGYMPGNTTAGLSAEYGRDQMYDSCMAGAAGPDAAVGPASAPPAANIGGTFTPAAR
jgi:hypothetical protein